MPFGKRDVDRVWNEVYLPVAESLGFDAVRMDQRDNGKIVIDQIVNYVSTSDLIVGDITYERPNCYFELGYARALKNHEEIILCARLDHVDHSRYRPKFLSFNPPFGISISLVPSYAPPRVHFDLAGFNVIGWDLEDLTKFQFNFDLRLKERLALITERKAVPEAAQPTATSPALVQPSIDLEAIAVENRRKLEQL